MKNKLLLTIMMFLALLVGSCQNVHRASDKKIETTIAKKIEDAQVKSTSVSELMISQKIVLLVSPLVLAVFVSIPMIFMGARLIGLGILVSAITCLVLVVTMATYMELVSIIGIAVLIIGIFFLFREIYKKNLFSKQLVKSVETAKGLLDEDEKGILKGSLLELQSDFTKNVVKNIKKTINR